MKLIVFNVIIGASSVIFGMEDKRVTPYVAQGNLYIQYGFDKYAPFNRNGTLCDTNIFDENELKPPSKFKGDIIKKEDKYYIKAKIQYRRDACIDLGKYPFFVPIDLTKEQLKELAKIRSQGQFGGDVFALDDKGNQFYIDGVPRELDFSDEEKEIKIIDLEIRDEDDKVLASKLGSVLALTMAYTLYVTIFAFFLH